MRSALIAICGFLAAAAPAAAGEYTVYSCQAGESGRYAGWTAAASSSHMTAYFGGCGASGGGLVARAGVEPAGSLAAPFDAASWRFDAPAGAAISLIAISGRLYRAAGGSWGVGLSNQDGVYLLGGISADATAWESRGYASIATPNSSSLYFGVLCAAGTGCPTTSTGQSSWGFTRARADLYGARVRVSESSPPSISGLRGTLVSGAWVAGTASVAFDAADPVGVASQSYAAGALASTDEKSCDFSRPAPCPTSSSSQFSVDTLALPDGEQPVTFAATDSAGNRSAWAATARVDNNRPAAPSQPSLQGLPGSRWRAQNGFVLTYENPSRAGGAPLSSHDVQICPSDSDGVVDPSKCSLSNRLDAPGTDTVELPAPGTFRMRVRVNDSLYAGAWSPWSEVLRFDDVAPEAPSVAFPERWINAAVADRGLEFSTGRTGVPASGISGYVVGGLPGGERFVTPAVGGTALLPYPLFPEGSSTLTIRAVSGAGLTTDPTRQAAGTVRKDTIPPSLSVVGAPDAGQTVAYPVTVTASATDLVSGMTGAPETRPVTDGGYVSLTSAGAPPVQFRGDFGQVSPGNGRQSIVIFASDAAGNLSREARVTYTQDTREPDGGLLLPPSDSPSRIRFRVEEGCLRSATIQVSESPGSWNSLPTVLGAGVVSSEVPGSVMNADAPYTLRALVTDCAGNSATLDRWADGPMAGAPIGEIRPPKRTRTSASASIRAPRRGAATVSARPTVSGYVRGPDGRPLRGVRVLFQAQPRATGQAWKTVATAETSDTGRVSRLIPSPCSQLIRIAVPETALLAPSTSNVLRTSVRATGSIAAKPSRLRNGRRVTLSGRLRGGLVPPRFEITLYGLAPGSRSWVPVRAPVAVSRSGRWSASYRFTRTRTRSRYSFRVRIPSRPDYPFSSGYSPVRKVTVLP